MSESLLIDLKTHVRTIPDFPKKGILFRDVTTLLKDPAAFRQAIQQLADYYKEAGITKVVGIESRGFLTAAPLAFLLGAGFVPVRKKGKLPAPIISVSYDLEYGKDTLEISSNAFTPDDKILITDDLLATGGTAQATCALVQKAGGTIVGLGFLIELTDLKGREKLSDFSLHSLIKF